MAYEGWDPEKLRKKKWYETERPIGYRQTLTRKEHYQASDRAARLDKRRKQSAKKNQESIENNPGGYTSNKPGAKKPGGTYINKNGVRTTNEQKKFVSQSASEKARQKKNASIQKDEETLKKLTNALRNAFSK